MNKKYLLFILPLIAISAVYGYSEYKYDNNVKLIDNDVKSIKQWAFNGSVNGDSSDSRASVLDIALQNNETYTESKKNNTKILKLINETKSYTFFNNKKTQHLINSQIVVETYVDFTNTKIEACDSIYKIMTSQGLFGMLGFDFKHYNNTFVEYQKKINETNI